MERNTRQRQAIREVLERSPHPLTTQEVLEQAQAVMPGLGIATVYRSLKSFADEGLIVTVETPGQPPRYETAGRHHHHHFHCTACGRLFEVEACPANVEALAPPGFRVDRHEITLYGVCGGCS